MAEAIELEAVSKRLGERQVLKNVSFAVKPGDIFGYLGPNGAGKTTTIRALLGLLKPDSGSASIFGQDVSHDGTRQEVGFVLESDGLYNSMTGYDNIEFYSRIYGTPGAKTRIQKVLGLTGMADRAMEKVGTYSKGMRQRLALARAMVHDPEVLILDEPTAGVDPTGQIEVRQVMLDITRKEGKTIFLSSHNLDEVQRICNRIALIDRGQIRLYGELDKLQREKSRGGVLIETAQPVNETVLADLVKLPEIAVLSNKDTTLVLSVGRATDVADLVNFLSQNGVRIEQVKRQEASLEEIYTAILREVEH